MLLSKENAWMRTLYESAYFHVIVVGEKKQLRVRRTATPFATVPEAEQAFEALGAALGGYPIEGHSLLLDVREAVGRNDAAFEHMITEKRGLLFGRFEKRAILLATMAGVLQTQRLDRETGERYHLEPFTDEARALAYLER